MLRVGHGLGMRPGRREMLALRFAERHKPVRLRQWSSSDTSLMARKFRLKFKAHNEYAKADIEQRQVLLQSICEVIWGTDSNSEIS